MSAVSLAEPREAPTKRSSNGFRRRISALVRLDVSHNLRRPLFLILVLILAVTAWGLTTGGMRISSGDASVGGKRAFITSEHSNGFVLSILTLLYYGFFVAVAAGMAIPKDDEQKVGE